MDMYSKKKLHKKIICVLSFSVFKLDKIKSILLINSDYVSPNLEFMKFKLLSWSISIMQPPNL